MTDEGKFIRTDIIFPSTFAVMKASGPLSILNRIKSLRGLFRPITVVTDGSRRCHEPIVLSSEAETEVVSFAAILLRNPKKITAIFMILDL